MFSRSLLSSSIVVLLLVNLGASDDRRVLDAARSRNKPALQALLKQRADVNAPQGDGATALHWAAHWDDLEAADLLIRAGAGVNAADDHGATPLWLASLNGSEAMIEKLLKAGANPNAPLMSGETPLMTASRSGSLAGVKSLLAHGALVNVKEVAQGQTALMWAVAQQHPDVVQALVEGGADVHARTGSRNEVATTGVYRDETFGAFVEVQQGGFTPLLFAARSGDAASAKILLAAGANLNDTAADGTSALVVAIHSGHDALASLLLDKGADVNAMRGGYSALHIAVRAGKQELVKTLLARGARVDAVLVKPTATTRSTRTDISLHYSLVGTTPFWIAARLADLGMMRLLVAHGANPSFVAPGGRTILMAPVSADALPAFRPSEARGLEVVKAALEFGADVNATTEKGETALHSAAKLGYNSVVQFLAENGARLDVKNGRGETPLAMTLPYLNPFSDQVVEERKSTAELLRKLGAKE
jgi:ankyrin